ncbi:hypothetical protein JT318_gp25 [Pseudomonas phage PspYZU01]|uniref:Uncharacterized protein n=1 Tax=Pseudomonas phage PspYZU01 TaxID=1983555 RepID=A0A2U7N298_9CAUD|nr:hypothetical protein JT318_gp25 [Pseudomonas phage PspYZU01]ASD51910.1 hypothetical protein PspYZU01_25 [Pseudomonas phage PspYZU01]
MTTETMTIRNDRRPAQPRMIASTRTNDADDFRLRREDFEGAFLARAAATMFPTVENPILPVGVGAFLLKRRDDGEYENDNTQDLWIGWSMAVEEGAPSTAASAYRSQLEAQLRLAKAEVAQLKVSLQMTDKTFARKVFWTRLMNWLDKFALAGSDDARKR